VDEKDDQIAHLSIIARTGNARDWSENQQFAIDRPETPKAADNAPCSGLPVENVVHYSCTRLFLEIA
jgi:hypothetical protein